MVGDVFGDEMLQRKLGSERLVVKGQYSDWDRGPLPP